MQKQTLTFIYADGGTTEIQVPRDADFLVADLPRSPEKPIDYEADWIMNNQLKIYLHRYVVNTGRSMNLSRMR